ncbi:hypothetical protein CcaverHIS002_0505800 [Cutaneotrichosporon cavernicola]|nr:hypothetical protein CcaverHIS002_0505800 [Cutaneotrichosporon cavernicola]
MDPSPQFLLLAATVLDSPLDSDIALLQLHSVFGPMLMSALQLVDRREVVRVDLGGRGDVSGLLVVSANMYLPCCWPTGWAGWLRRA